MGFQFFHLPKHRVFNYTPIYYDENKEKYGRSRGKTDENGNYIPGSIVEGGFRKNAFASRPRKDSYSRWRRYVVYALLATILALLFYYSKMFAHMLALLKIQIDA